MTMLRLALGSFKDQAAIGKAIMSAHCLFPDIEIAIVRATAHDDAPTDEKYVHEILYLVSNARGSTTFLAERISRRLKKTSDPIVALKTLLLVHRLMRGGDRNFEQELHCAKLSGHLRMNNLQCFMHNAHNEHLISFLCSYTAFLEERMEWVINQGGKLEPVMQRSFYDHKSMDMVFCRLPRCQTLLDKVMDCLPMEVSCPDRLTQAALANILRESIQVYNSFCEGVATLVDSVPKFGKKAKEEALDIFKKASSQSCKLFDFFERCKRLIDNRNMEYPSVQIISSSWVKSLEDCLSCSSPDLGHESVTVITNLAETKAAKGLGNAEEAEEIEEVDSGFSSELKTRISTVWVEFNDGDAFDRRLSEPTGGLTMENGRQYTYYYNYNPFLTSFETNYNNFLRG